MAKKETSEQPEDARVSRKDILIARRDREQNRQVYTVVGIVVAFILLILLAGGINELFIKPTRPAAVVNGEAISLRDWQARVRYQRAQLVINVEDLIGIYGSDPNILQQVAGQQLNLLFDPDALGQLVLELMVDETLIRQEAARRGITVTDAEIQTEIEELFGYFGGLSPTPAPTASPTIMPTPSLTPIPTAVITPTDTIAEPTPTQIPLPTQAPLPTATPMSQESFQSEFDAVLQQLRGYGVRENIYRDAIRARIYQEKLREALAEAITIRLEDEQVSFFVLIYETEEEAEAARAAIATEGFLPIWNQLRSLPFDDEDRGTGFASELLWRTRDDLTNIIGAEATNAAFNLPLNAPSEVYAQAADPMTGQPERYYIIQVSGREVRPLTQAAVDQQKQEALTGWLDQQRASGVVEITERWRGQSPRQPMIDTSIFRQPAPIAP